MSMALRNKICIIPSLCVFWILAHSVIITIDGLHDDIVPCDAAVVLGNMVNPDGTPSARLAARLDTAVKLFTMHYCKVIIVSGGIDPDGNDEAAVMKSYLVGKGIPAGVIITDPEGINTYSTAKNTKRLLAERGMKSVIVVSQYHHITRTVMAFRSCGINPVHSAHAEFFEWRDLYSLFREFIAYYSYVIRY